MNSNNKRNEQTAAIPVVVLTGMADANLRRRMQKLGVVQYLNKPVPFDDLLAAITSCVSAPA
jgi:FixJ family two-component response regulator